MWCSVSSSTCSSVLSRSSRARSNGPATQIKWQPRLLPQPPRAYCFALPPQSPIDPPAPLPPGRRLDHLRLPVLRVPRTRVRSTSCRPTHLASAALQRRTSSSPLQPQRHRACCRPRPGSSWSRNHSRCCANDNGSSGPAPPLHQRRLLSSSPRPPLLTPRRAPPPSAPRTAPAAAPPPRTPARTRAITRVASSECPPSSKKLSSTHPLQAQHLRPDPAQQLFHRRARRPYCPPSRTDHSGAGSAAGPPSRSASAATPPTPPPPLGTMYSGNRSRKCSPQLRHRRQLRSGLPPPHTPPAASAPLSLLPHHHHRLRTPGCSRSAASISPGSIR